MQFTVITLVSFFLLCVCGVCARSTHPSFRNVVLPVAHPLAGLSFLLSEVLSDQVLNSFYCSVDFYRSTLPLFAEFTLRGYTPRRAKQLGREIYLHRLHCTNSTLFYPWNGLGYADKVYKEFHRVSQLNGYQGEVTGKDDVVVFEVEGVVYTLDGQLLTIGGENPSPLEEVRIEAFRAFSYLFHERRVLFCRELYLIILARLGSLPDEPRNYTILVNFLNDKFRALPASFIVDCIYVYAIKNKGKCTPSNVRGSENSIYGIMNAGAATSIDTTLSIEPPLYRYNARWKVLRSKEFTLAVGGDQMLTRLVAFGTNSPPKQTLFNKFYYFNLTPRVPFQVYGESGANCCSALSRYFKSRPDEETLYANQFRLLAGIPMDIIAKCATICDATLNDEDGGTVITFREVFRCSRETRHKLSIPLTQGYGVGALKARYLQQLTLSLLLILLWNKLSGACLEVYTLVCALYRVAAILLNPFTYYEMAVSIPHVKQKLYFAWLRDRESKVILNQGSWEAKLKWENGKVGKVPRLYATGEHLAIVDKVDSDVSKFISSVPVPLFLDYFSVDGTYSSYKGAWNNIWPSKPLDVIDAKFSFYTAFCDAQAKSDCDAMYDQASNLPNNSAKFFYFSDDSFLVMNFQGNLILYEIDISQCDASNSFPIFVLVYYYLHVLGLGENMLKLLAQAARPVTVRNPSNPSEFVELRPQSFNEYSGIRCTTCLNNVASECIGLSMGRTLMRWVQEESGDLVSLTNDLIDAAKEYGYIITIARAESLNQMTFLKRAYNGTTSWLVYGCIFRSLGVTEGLLTADQLSVSKEAFRTLSETDKFDRLLSSAVKGLCNEPASTLMDALRNRAARCHCRSFGLEPLPAVVEQIHATFAATTLRISDSDLLDRYGGSEYEILHLASLIMDLTPFDVITADFLERIFAKDYGTTPQLTRYEAGPGDNLSFAQTF